MKCLNVRALITFKYHKVISNYMDPNLLVIALFEVTVSDFRVMQSIWNWMNSCFVLTIASYPSMFMKYAVALPS